MNYYSLTLSDVAENVYPVSAGTWNAQLSLRWPIVWQEQHSLLSAQIDNWVKSHPLYDVARKQVIREYDWQTVDFRDTAIIPYEIIGKPDYMQDELLMALEEDQAQYKDTYQESKARLVPSFTLSVGEDTYAGPIRNGGWITAPDQAWEIQFIHVGDILNTGDKLTLQIGVGE